MKISTDLDLSYNGTRLAHITKCQVYAPSNTFAGVELTFNLTIEPTDVIKDKYPKLEKFVVDLYLMKDSTELYLGQLKDRFIEPSTLNYSREHQFQLELAGDTFLKLIDEAHFKDLELKIKAQAAIKTDEPLKNFSGGPLTGSNQVYVKGETRITFPHSEWLKILNATNIERFNLITLRTVLSELPESNVFAQAFDKLKEAEGKFNRGDWNAVGSTCRNALSTVLSLAGSGKSKIQDMLSPMMSDPQRELFGTAAEQAIDKIRNLLNYATHQGGNANANMPPANLQREDALLTLHLTAAAISYIAAVHK